MARFRLGGLISEVRGRLGSIVYIPSYSSGLTRAKTARPRAVSPAQAAWRAQVRAAHVGWNALGEADRAAWNEWADAYGTLANPDAVPTVSGVGRWLGQFVMRAQLGLPPIAVPADPGIGNAVGSFLRFTCDEGSSVALAESAVPYPTPPTGPAHVLVSSSPIYPLGSMSFRKRWTVQAGAELVGGGPGLGGPALPVPLPGPLGKGQGVWFRTRVVAGSGNTSSEALWPFFQPPIGFDRAFRTGPLWFIFTPQQIRVSPTTLSIDITTTDPYDFTIDYPLGSGPTATIGGLAAAIAADGLWGVWDANSAVSARPSTDLVPIRRARPIVESQPVLLTLPE